MRRRDACSWWRQKYKSASSKNIPLKCIHISVAPRSVLFLYTDGHVGREDGLSFTPLSSVSCGMTQHSLIRGFSIRHSLTFIMWLQKEYTETQAVFVFKSSCFYSIFFVICIIMYNRRFPHYFNTEVTTFVSLRLVTLRTLCSLHHELLSAHSFPLRTHSVNPLTSDSCPHCSILYHCAPTSHLRNATPTCCLMELKRKEF